MSTVINRHGRAIQVSDLIYSNTSLLKKYGYKKTDHELPLQTNGTYKIGVGITTCNRPEVFKKTLQHIERYTPNAKIFVNDDSKKREGVAKAKNNCLAALDDCEHIFLFDDDCFPIRHNWAELFIQASSETGNHHFSLTFGKLYNGRPNGNRLLSADDTLENFSNPCGMMLYFNRRCLQRVGGFDINYDTYGYEHVGLSHRIYNAGLTTAPFLSVAGAMDYFYSYDYYARALSGAAINKRALIKNNETLFKIEREESIFKPYKVTDSIMSVYLCSQPDVQRGIYFKPEFSAVEAWVRSVQKCGMQAILFHDCFSAQQQKEWSNEHLRLIKVDAPVDVNALLYRYSLFESYLSRFKPCFRNVFFTDCTDVEVLQSPFTHPDFNQKRIYAGDEPSLISCEWMKREGQLLSSSNPAYATFEKEEANSSLLNAGIIGGDINTVLPFIKDMAALCDQWRSKVKTDMPLFNFLAYSNRYRDVITHGPQINTAFKKYERNNKRAWFRHK